MIVQFSPLDHCFFSYRISVQQMNAIYSCVKKKLKKLNLFDMQLFCHKYMLLKAQYFSVTLLVKESDEYV